jgi:ligand-binding sensor domain-containing protein
MNVWISQGIGVSAKERGLFLTDGTNWSEYKLGERGLPTTTIIHTATDGRNRLWLSLFNFGLCCFDGQSTTVYEYGQPGFLTEDMWITDLCVDKLDRVLVATLAHGVYRLSNDIWEKVTEEEVLTDQIVTFGIDRENDLWVACCDAKETRFLSYKSDLWEPVCSFPLGTRSMDQVLCFVVDKDENIWVGRERRGLMVWNGDNWKRLTERDCSLLYGDIRDLAVDEYNNLWVSPGGRGLAIFDGAQWHVWEVVRPSSTQHPIPREDLLRNSSGVETSYVYIGGHVAIDGIGRKWIPASTGIVMFSPQGG